MLAQFPSDLPEPIEGLSGDVESASAAEMAVLARGPITVERVESDYDCVTSRFRNLAADVDLRCAHIPLSAGYHD